MATRYRFGDSQYPHFITFAVVNWIDALSRPVYKDICLCGCSQKGDAFAGVLHLQTVIRL